MNKYQFWYTITSTVRCTAIVCANNAEEAEEILKVDGEDSEDVIVLKTTPIMDELIVSEVEKIGEYR